MRSQGSDCRLLGTPPRSPLIPTETERTSHGVTRYKGLQYPGCCLVTRLLPGAPARHLPVSAHAPHGSPGQRPLQTPFPQGQGCSSTELAPSKPLVNPRGPLFSFLLGRTRLPASKKNISDQSQEPVPGCPISPPAPPSCMMGLRGRSLEAHGACLLSNSPWATSLARLT